MASNRASSNKNTDVALLNNNKGVKPSHPPPYSEASSEPDKPEMKETAILVDDENEATPLKARFENNHIGSKHKENGSAQKALGDGTKKPGDGAHKQEAQGGGVDAAGKDGGEESEADSELDETDEVRLQNAVHVNKLVLHTQMAVTRAFAVINHRCKGRFISIVCLLLYIAFFIYAMYHRFGDEASIRLLWMTILGVIIASRHRLGKLIMMTRFGKWCSSEKPPHVARRIQTARFFIRWLMYGGAGAFMAYIIVDVGINDTTKLRSVPGIIVFLLICFLFSTSPSHVEWHTVYWSVALQFIMAVLVMRWRGGKEAVLWVQDRMDEFFANSKYASINLFGKTYEEHYMLFGALPIVFLTNATLSVLYYLGAMQFLIKIIGVTLRYVLWTSPIESTGVAASIFMEGASALLVLRPYLQNLTHSALFCLVTACMASIGGAFLAILAQMGFSVEFMLPAMVISCPATFAVCKLIAPETKKPKKVNFDGDLPMDMQYGNILEAAQSGAISVISLVANVVVSAYAFLSLISWTNNTLTWFGDRVGIYNLTMQKVMSYLFFPCAVLMGVEMNDCRNVAMLMGYRLATSNFLSMLKMKELTENRAIFRNHMLTTPNATYFFKGDDLILPQLNMTLLDGYITRRSEAIATYALCGFSGLLSLFITIGILTTLVPTRRRWLTKQAMALLVAGNIANFMVGCFAGLLVDSRE